MGTAGEQAEFEANLAAFLESAPDAMIVVDRSGVVRLANGHAERLFGWKRADLVGSPIDVLVPVRYRERHPAHRQGYADAPRARPMGATSELHGVRKDGTEFPAEISLSPMKTPWGDFVTAAVRDISERKRADQRFRDLLESAPDAMVIVDRTGTIVRVNSQTERVFGWPRTEIVGKKVETLVPERFVAGHPAHRDGFFKEPKVRAMGSGLELFGRRRDGTEFPVEISLSPIQTDDGILVSSTIRDVTDRKRADELRMSLAAIVDSSDDAIIGKDLDGIIRTWNRGAERVFGYTAHEAVGHPISLLHPPDPPGEEPAILARLRNGERVDPFETVRRCKDGRVIDVSVTISPIHDTRGNVVGASKVARDISDRKRAEAEVARARLRAETASRELEAFSYSVAHDLRAPLRGIDGFSIALLEDYADKLDPPGKRYLDRIRGHAQRMAQLIDALLSLARITKGDIKRERVDISALAREAADRVRAAQPEHQPLVSIEAGLTAIGDGRLLSGVFDNLFGNAWKFTRHTEAPMVKFGRRMDGGRDVYFVEDNGAGFDMAYAAKLFGVFQRLHTTAEFEGTGVGLATVQRVIQRHGGQIWAKGEVGKGATFSFTLNERSGEE